MSTQSQVRFDQASGVVGDIVLEGPVRACPCILKSTYDANNVIGRAFCYVDGSDTYVSADGGTVFAGILANSKTYALNKNSLEPSLVLTNGTNVELVTMTSGILVMLITTAKIGDSVFYKTDSGALSASAEDVLENHVLIPGARVVRNNLSGSERLAIVQLN